MATDLRTCRLISTRDHRARLAIPGLHGVNAIVTLEPWSSGDLPLLERLMGDPRMTEHFGGPESPDKLRERQGRYERLEGGDRRVKNRACSGPSPP